jgi:hypothetical protein
MRFFQGADELMALSCPSMPHARILSLCVRLFADVLRAFTWVGYAPYANNEELSLTNKEEFHANGPPNLQQERQ